MLKINISADDPPEKLFPEMSSEVSLTGFHPHDYVSREVWNFTKKIMYISVVIR